MKGQAVLTDVISRNFGGLLLGKWLGSCRPPRLATLSLQVVPVWVMVEVGALLRVTSLLWCPQIEEALVRRKKMELLQKYASETLQAQSEEAKRLLGY